MNKNFETGSRGVAACTSLLAVQIIGAIVFIWKELPAFNQLLRNAGEQLPYIPYDDLTLRRCDDDRHFVGDAGCVSVSSGTNSNPVSRFKSDFESPVFVPWSSQLIVSPGAGRPSLRAGSMRSFPQKRKSPQI
jgi:hypothetical protein